MTDATFPVLAGTDDGHADLDDSNFDNTGIWIQFGRPATNDNRSAFFRFDNVTIPAGSNITSAVIRLPSPTTTTNPTCIVKVHCEDADDPAAPTTAADMNGRSLTTGVDWNTVPAFSFNSNYSSPDFTSDLQTVIDRGGWASGQAVTVHIRNNGSTNGHHRIVAGYEDTTTTQATAELVVSYDDPYQISASESIEISESISFESDLVQWENVSLTENLTVLLGFDESLPTITEDVTITESVTVERGFAGVHEEIQNINISEYAVVDVGPQILVFESITLSDYGNIQPEFAVDDSISIAEDVEIYRGYWADVDDNFVFTDTFSVFNYTSWLKTNKAKSKERFFFTLTGASDQTDDIEIPVSNVFARKRTDDPTYLQVTIPSFNYSADIATRSNAEMIVEMGYEIDGEITLREQILIADLEDIAVYEGPINRSVTLSGHKTISYSSNLIVLARDEVIYRAVQTRARVFRFSHIDPFLNPGDTVVIGDESMTCNNIIYTIGAQRSVMEVREGL